MLSFATVIKIKFKMKLPELKEKIKDSLLIKNVTIREFFAEFLGTFILVVFGCGVNAQSTLSRGQFGGFLSVNIGWGWGVAFGAWIAGGVSGAHLNPAVTLTTGILGRHPLIKIPVYWLAQYLGAFVASACVFGVYYDALNDYDGGVRSVTGENATAGIWGTYPQPYMTLIGGFGDQVFGTMLLVLCIMALTDRANLSPSPGMLPLCIGGLIAAIGICFGMNCGYAINPARDFGPRAFTAVGGWGVEVFTAFNYWCWVPLVAPHVGAICGAWIYQIFIGIHLREFKKTIDENVIVIKNADDTKSEVASCDDVIISNAAFDDKL